MSIKDLEDREHFLKASIVHEKENLERAEYAVSSIEDKVGKYQELLDSAKESVPKAHDEIVLIRGRLDTAEAELKAVQSELEDSREG
jgi:chromosome segregation ATPase